MPVGAQLLALLVGHDLGLGLRAERPVGRRDPQRRLQHLDRGTLEPTFSTTLSYAAYVPVGRSASALRARQTDEVTTPVALSFLAFW